MEGRIGQANSAERHDFFILSEPYGGSHVDVVARSSRTTFAATLGPAAFPLPAGPYFLGASGGVSLGLVRTGGTIPILQAPGRARP